MYVHVAFVLPYSECFKKSFISNTVMFVSLRALHCMCSGKPRLGIPGEIFVEVSLFTIIILLHGNYPLYGTCILLAIC